MGGPVTGNVSDRHPFQMANDSLRFSLKELKNTDGTPFAKKEETAQPAQERPVKVSWKMFFTAMSLRRFERCAGRKIEEMDFSQKRPFGFSVDKKDYNLSLEKWGELIRQQMGRFLQMKGPKDDAAMRRLLCLIRDGMGREMAARQAEREAGEKHGGN